MIIIFKKIIKFILLLLPWGLTSLIFRDYSYYKEINTPFFAPPTIVFPIVWTILYILITYTIYKVLDKKNKNYLTALIINYVSNQLFTVLFFALKNNFLAFLDALIVFLSSIYLYIETKEIDNKVSKLLIPYLLWNLFATILSMTILFLN